MIRVLLGLILLFVLALGLAWVAEQPGDIVIRNFLGVDIEAPLAVAAVGLLAVFVVAALLWTLLRTIVRSPKIVGGYFSARRRDRGYRALSRGMLAVGGGDARLAARSAGEASKLLAGEPLTLLLTAQAAQLQRDTPAARAAFEEMLKKPETRLLGLHGLYVEARRAGEHEAARHFAEEAVRDKPGIGWAGSAVFEYQAAAGDWHAAMRTLATNRRAKSVEPEKAVRLQAVLETAEAMSLEAGRPEEARVLALSAHRRAPELVPAAVLSARLSSRLGDIRKATRVLERAWKVFPHPDIAAAYKAVRPGDSVRDRLRRMRKLAELRPGEREGRLALAEAAIDARAFDEARSALAAEMAAPTERVCLLLADLAEAENDQGSARDWLARAVRAPRDAAWVSDGRIYESWAPVSPLTGRLDAFEWRVPEDRSAQTIAALDLRQSEKRGEAMIAATPAEPLPPPAQAELDLEVVPAPAEERPAVKAEAAAVAPPKPETAAKDAARKDAVKAEPAPGLIRPPDDPGPDPLETDSPEERPRGRF